MCGGLGWILITLSTPPREVQNHFLLQVGKLSHGTGFVQDVQIPAWSAVGKGIFPSILSSLRMKSSLFPATDQQSKVKAEPACRLWQAGRELDRFTQHRAAGTLHAMEGKSGVIVNSHLIQTSTPAFPRAEIQSASAHGIARIKQRARARQPAGQSALRTLSSCLAEGAMPGFPGGFYGCWQLLIPGLAAPAAPGRLRVFRKEISQCKSIFPMQQYHKRIVTKLWQDLSLFF